MSKSERSSTYERVITVLRGDGAVEVREEDDLRLLIEVFWIRHDRIKCLVEITMLLRG